MIVNVFGSTKNEVHFGCKSLTHGLEELLHKKHSNISVIDHTLHKYLSPGFEETFRSKKRVGRKTLFSLLKKSLTSKGGVELPENKNKTIDFQKWEKSVDVILQDNFIRKKILVSDLNIINVEGTIHNQNINGLYLLALSKAIKKLGKKVQWVNVTIQGEDSQILKEAIGDLELPTREKFTFKYLNENGLNPVEAFDTAVLAPFKLDSKNVEKEWGKVLITGGVKRGVDLYTVISEVHKLGKTPVYLPAAISDVENIEEMKTEGIESIPLASIHYLDLPQFIQKFEFVISGRHHLNILSAIAGVPFIPLKSNSWKTEGLVEFFEIQELYNDNLDVVCQNLLKDYSKYEDLMVKGVNKAKELALNN